MYRIIIKSCGKYHNVTLGARYCVGKKTALHLVNLMEENECEYAVEKFVRLTRKVWAWSEIEANEALFPEE